MGSNFTRTHYTPDIAKRVGRSLSTTAFCVLSHSTVDAGLFKNILLPRCLKVSQMNTFLNTKTFITPTDYLLSTTRNTRLDNLLTVQR